jgi:hypothetical protein
LAIGFPSASQAGNEPLPVFAQLLEQLGDGANYHGDIEAEAFCFGVGR